MTKAETEDVLEKLVATMTVLSEQVSQHTQDMKEAFADFHRLKKRISDLEERVTALDNRTLQIAPFNAVNRNTLKTIPVDFYDIQKSEDLERN